MKEAFRARCQVATPQDIVDLLWEVALNARQGRAFSSVVDLGAGDARFAAAGKYRAYLGVESDPKRKPSSPLPPKAKFVHRDAMFLARAQHDLAIGNPPYIRHHHLEPEWRQKALSNLESAGGPRLKSTANLFVLFLLQALLQTAENGLVVQLVPFEWVTRPSALELRKFITDKGWSVRVLRFNADIFPTVLTTASITVIDKAAKKGDWFFGEIDREGQVRPVTNPSGSSKRVLPYAGREGNCHALRGLSPGGQDIFVLTEEQRLYHGLHRSRDVMPCVTSLRTLSGDVSRLDSHAFQQGFVDAGRPCWLIRSDKKQHSEALASYLEFVGDRWERYSTCRTRLEWWKFRNHATPQALLASGFVGKSPKVLTNTVGAMAVGSVYGVHIAPDLNVDDVVDGVRRYDFRRRVVSHANNLCKVEVGQLNAVLKRLFG